MIGRREGDFRLVQQVEGVRLQIVVHQLQRGLPVRVLLLRIFQALQILSGLMGFLKDLPLLLGHSSPDVFVDIAVAENLLLLDFLYFI